MILVARNLYLGDLSSLSSLPSHPHITATLSLLTPPHISYPSLLSLPPTHTHLALPLSDTPTASLLAHLPTALPFIASHTASSALLIHCFHGHSRSVAAALAHLLTLSPPSALPPAARVAAALASLSRAYPPAAPSASFLRQLAAFTERLPLASAAYVFPPTARAAGPLERAELLRCLRHAWPPAAPHHSPPWRALALPDPAPRDAAARCRRCRAPLLAPASFEHAAATQPRSPVLEILPPAWVARQVEKAAAERGRMRCPQCAAKVGAWRKGGEALPRFEVTVSAVDFVAG